MSFDSNVTGDQLAALAAPFPSDEIGWRVASTNKDRSKAMAVAYIDARTVQRRLDEVMGCDWQNEIIVQSSGLVTCKIGLLIDGIWRWRMDGTAAVREQKPEGEKLDIKEEQEREMSQKGAASDSFKRAAVQWGIGRYIYSLPSPWVQINQWRQIVDEEMPRLRKAHDDGVRRIFGSGHQQTNVQPMRPPAAQPHPAPGAEQSSASQGLTERDRLLAEARKNQDFKRIEMLLERNPQTTGDVHRIINEATNLAALQAMPDNLKILMREIVERTKERVASRTQNAAAAAA